ncbi:hypothetical protein RM611_03680 [Staphylococcus chromogenes]|uniref:hypothetical protein n=1 Tax=Staphylococcus chromogenes TaxID=46126 RepID=UPI002887512D|nr:hypothetical protein [Staphylococcus chromogenes]MDT0692704.1 hypothetical protein [Staphylococcus chromogenes]MDT0700274.1 hypothetical protein [Staphylococcus chromogenes]
MVKIKVKKEMTLPELIQWGWKNREEQRIFHGSKYGSVCFNDDSWVIIERAVEPDETFEVEIEQEITEKTVIPEILHVYEYGGDTITSLDKNYSISSLIKMNEHRLDLENLAFYMLNDDMTMTLIWRNGGMVE